MKTTRNVNINEEDVEFAKALGISLSELIREAIEFYKPYAIKKRVAELEDLSKKPPPEDEESDENGLATHQPIPTAPGGST